MAVPLLVLGLVLLVLLELKVHRAGIRAIGIILVALLLVGASANIGIEIGRALQSNAIHPHLSALFGRFARLANANDTETLKRDVLLFQGTMPKVLSDEEALAQIVNEIENAPPMSPQTPSPR